MWKMVCVFQKPRNYFVPVSQVMKINAYISSTSYEGVDDSARTAAVSLLRRPCIFSPLSAFILRLKFVLG
jgi:hypothetical protein